MREGTTRRQRLDTTHAGGNPGLVHEHKDADLRGIPHMRAAAQLLGEAADADHAHGVAVLLVEQCRRTIRDRIGVRHDPCRDRRTAPDRTIHDRLDLGALHGGHRTMMREVEAQAIRTHQRARLVHMIAKHLAQRGVQQVRGRVISLDVATHGCRYGRAHGPKRDVPRRSPDHGGSSVDLLDVLDLERPAFAGDVPTIGDLAAGFRVERCVAQDQRDALIVERADRGDVRRRLQVLVAHELRLRQRGGLGLPR